MQENFYYYTGGNMVYSHFHSDSINEIQAFRFNFNLRNPNMLCWIFIIHIIIIIIVILHNAQCLPSVGLSKY